MESLANLPEPLKWAAGILGTLAAGMIFMRQYLSGAEAQRASDAGQIAALDVYKEMVSGLRDQVATANQRADQFAKERNEAIEQIGQLKGQMAEMSRQIKEQSEELTHLRGEVQQLSEGLHAKL